MPGCYLLYSLPCQHRCHVLLRNSRLGQWRHNQNLQSHQHQWRRMRIKRRIGLSLSICIFLQARRFNKLPILCSNMSHQRIISSLPSLLRRGLLDLHFKQRKFCHSRNHGRRTKPQLRLISPYR